MNTIVKGSLAGATGIALLMGGFGTYALWSDSETTGSSQVTAGELDIAANTATWADASTDAATTTWTPGTDLVVPGDVIKRTQTFTIKGTGKNLKGNVALSQGAVTKTAYGTYMTVGVDVTSNNASVTRSGTTNNYNFTAPFGSATLTAVVTYTFDSTTPNQVAQNATASLADSTFTISQTR